MKKFGLVLVLSVIMLCGCGYEAGVEDIPVSGRPEEVNIVIDGPTVEFSHEAGFYGNDFVLELSAPENATIYYTLDGSDPTVSGSASEYKGAIPIYDNSYKPNKLSMIQDISLHEYYPPEYPIDKGIVVRAVFKDANGEYSAVATNSYFVKKYASYYEDFRVISMVTDERYLFDQADGIYMVGAEYYKWLGSDEREYYDPGDVLNPTNYNSGGKEYEIPAVIQVFEDGEEAYTQLVGTRISGNWSRGHFQKSFRFYARKEYGASKLEYTFFDELLDSEGEVIDKFDKITLRSGGNCHILHFRDALIQDLAGGLELDYMASEPYILFINGEFWGFYLMREKPEDYYIQTHYGIDDKEVVVIKNGELESGTDADIQDYYDFTIWAAKADMTLDMNYQKFCEQMDVQSFIDYMTVQTYIVNHDWASGYINNWMVWRSNLMDDNLPKADKRWRFILYDVEYAAGLYGGDDTAYYYDALGKNYVDNKECNLPKMLKNLCKNEEFRQRFYDSYVRIMEENFDPSHVNDVIDEYANTYREATEETHRRFGDWWKVDAYEDELNGLKDFFFNRPEKAKEFLDAYMDRVDGRLDSEESQKAYIEQYGNLTNFLPKVEHWYHFGNAEFTMDKENNGYFVHIDDFAGDSWETQLAVHNNTFEQGEEYRLTFEASFKGEGNVVMVINRTDDDVNWPTQDITEVTLGEEMQSYEFYFTSEMPTNDDFNFCIFWGKAKGDCEIKNIHMERVD